MTPDAALHRCLRLLVLSEIVTEGTRTVRLRCLECGREQERRGPAYPRRANNLGSLRFGRHGAESTGVRRYHAQQLEALIKRGLR